MRKPWTDWLLLFAFYRGHDFCRNRLQLYVGVQLLHPTSNAVVGTWKRWGNSFAKPSENQPPPKKKITGNIREPMTTFRFQVRSRRSILTRRKKRLESWDHELNEENGNKISKFICFSPRWPQNTAPSPHLSKSAVTSEHSRHTPPPFFCFLQPKTYALLQVFCNVWS